MEERGTRDDKPMKPQVVGWELGKRIPANAIVTSDSGTITTWWARCVPHCAARSTVAPAVLRR
jgi:pyruvate dehydrogenase (quinone)